MELLSDILRDLGFLLYAGPMVAWAVLMLASGRLHGVEPASIIRVFRSWGPGFGLSLGATVLGALLGRFLDTGTFQWSLSSPDGQLDAAVWALFLLMWISNIKLEIWTLEPLRKLDQDGVINDQEGYAAAASRLSRHLGVQALLLVALAVGATMLRS